MMDVMGRIIRGGGREVGGGGGGVASPVPRLRAPDDEFDQSSQGRVGEGGRGHRRVFY